MKCNKDVCFRLPLHTTSKMSSLMLGTSDLALQSSVIEALFFL